MTASNVNTKAFHALSYGVYIVSAEHDGKRAGCIVNTFQQVTSKPPRVSVAVNKENVTADVIKAAGRFEASVLAQDAPMELIGKFGFQSSADIDKFDGTQFEVDPAGMPYVTEKAVANFGARVIETVDAGTHYIFVGEVDFSQVLSDEPALTYAYYRQVKGGGTPPKASSYEAPAEEAAPAAAQPEPNKPRFGWQCKICKYVIEVDELPADFKCPICGMGREMFERIEL